MKKRIFRSRVFLWGILLLIFLLFNEKAMAQSSCATTTLLTSSTPFTSNLTTNDSSYFRFTANSSTILITVVNSSDTANYGHIHQLKLFSGSCSSLSLITTVEDDSTLSMAANGLTAGNTYYILYRHEDYEKTFGLRNFLPGYMSFG
jgi:hypothetical protein